MAAANPVDYLVIRNVIATYTIALDTKDWPLLGQVFTQDVDALYPFDGAPFKGLQAITDRIRERLQHITSQHGLTTQTVTVADDGKTASAVTYFTGLHFGKGKWQGQILTVWGKYIDDLVLINGEPTLPGASGSWRISRREVVFAGRSGEERLMKGDGE